MRAERSARAFGDGAVLVDVDGVDEARDMAEAIGATGGLGVEDVIVGFRSVTVVADPTVTDLSLLRDEVASLPSVPATRTGGRLVEIPVTLDGPDLAEVARLAGLSPSRVVDLLTGTELQVAFVGFAPGFAYLIGLPPALASVPRRPTPRPAVPGGSVALGGGFAGIYPQASPGGWQVVGRTGMRLFDPGRAPYSVMRAGDRVRFRAGGGAGTTEGAGMTGGGPSTGRRPPLGAEGPRTLTVETGGLLSLVQDGGRVGVAGLGVPRAGAADPYALRIANRLVGNEEWAAAIETTARGPTLRLSVPAHVAVVGTAEVAVDGGRVPNDSVVPVGAGQTLTAGDEGQGLRSYIAVSGGIDIATVLGSRSSDVLCGLGPGALVGGDVLGLGPPGHPGGRLRSGRPSGAGGTIRVLVGPDVFPAATVDRFLSTEWEVDPASDRIGVRLGAGEPLEGAGLETFSRGMVTGAVQLPPGGRPIVLLCDHATVGGYPVIATVVSADFGALGQLRPGDSVRFEPVDLLEAARARAGREQSISDSVIGWYPVRTD